MTPGGVGPGTGPGRFHTAAAERPPDAGERGAAVREALSGMELPARPVDGDCLIWARLVVGRLRAAGHDACETRVFGWLDRPTGLLGFLHLVALVDGDVVVDVTARQFSAALDPVWVADVESYRRELATVTRVSEVTVGGALGAPAAGRET